MVSYLFRTTKKDRVNHRLYFAGNPSLKNIKKMVNNIEAYKDYTLIKGSKVLNEKNTVYINLKGNEVIKK